MLWTRMLAYITGTVDQELLLRSEYLAAMALRKTARSRNPLHWSSASRPSTPSTMPSSMTRTPSVDGNLNDSTFGQILKSQPGRVSQVALKFLF